MLSDMVIDGCPTVAEYVVSAEDANENDFNDLICKDQTWHLKHVRESQYLLQISKCDDENCCSVRRSSLFRVIKDGYLPPPVPVKQTKNGLSYTDHFLSSSSITGKDLSRGQYLSLFQNLSLGSNMLPDIAYQKFPKEIPYDFSCPSIKTRLTERTCDVCCRYFGSISSLHSHYNSIHYSPSNTTRSRNATALKQNVKIIKPDRLLARRDSEILCLVKTSLNTDEFDWYAHTELDLSSFNIEDVPNVEVKSGIKVYTEKERSSIWTHS